MAQRKINSTKNYRLFTRSDDNRALKLPRHRRLFKSMQRYGFLACFPIVCLRQGERLIVKDGQHRLAIAEELGLEVYWVEELVDFDIAEINTTAKVWATRDYAEKFAANGINAYVEGLEFTDRHSLSVGTAFALLAGTTSFGNVQEQFMDGSFQIKDRDWADSVASVFSAVTALSGHVRSARFTEACMAACRVPEFDITRMISNAGRCREKLVSYSTKEAYLDMMEDIYNFGRKNLLALKISAQQAMRDRAVCGIRTPHKKTVRPCD